MDSPNSRCCIGVSAAPGLTGDALRVPDRATAWGVHRKVCAEKKKICCGKGLIG